MGNELRAPSRRRLTRSSAPSGSSHKHAYYRVLAADDILDVPRATCTPDQGLQAFMPHAEGRRVAYQYRNFVPFFQRLIHYATIGGPASSEHRYPHNRLLNDETPIVGTYIYC